MAPRSRELHFMSFAFDGAHERWLTALLAGGSLVMRDRQPVDRRNRPWRCCTVTASPSPASRRRTCSSWPKYAERRAAIRRRCEVYCFGGDAVPDASFEQVKRALRPQRLVNGYGPTETVVTPLLWKARPDEPCEAAYAPIGRRVGEPCACTCSTSTSIRCRWASSASCTWAANGLARGYHRRPGMTAERFVPDPFSATVAACTAPATWCASARTA